MRYHVDACFKKIGDTVIESVLEPLREIEIVAGELANGNLHSQLDYHSDDEIGKLAHDLREIYQDPWIICR